ncbi:MAG: hypothetical protein JSU73_08150 [candidate division WOR-3 bacterium]|nr:MAG: hypothetical protein JSU73_08150 [candidate division WOR-3 bacterium]
MRLWSLHPKYLDRAGLVAVWREALLAQAVLAGRTKGYHSHPQLGRFRGHPTPRRAIAAYLHGLWLEANARGYQFDPDKFRKYPGVRRIVVSRGQLDFEFEHLRRKLKSRDPARHEKLSGTEQVLPHPLFRVGAGAVADWENARRK